MLKDALVFDIGGTYLRAARFSFERQQMSNIKKKLTPNIWNLDDKEGVPYCLLISEMKVLSDELFGSDSPEVVVIGFPGPITPDGKVLSTPTIWGDSFKESAELIPYLKRLWANSHVEVINDVTAAGYYLKNIFKDDFYVITVSSGIGSKLFIDGKPYTGPMGRGGEIGHWVTDSSDDALICDCGGKGHLGGISSGRGTLAFAKKYVESTPHQYLNSAPGKVTHGDATKLTNELLVEHYKKGDLWTKQAVDIPARELAKVIAIVHNTIGIETFVIIGGFSVALGENYRKTLVVTTQQFCWDLGQDWNKMIHLGPEETEMGLLGAASFSKTLRQQVSQSPTSE